MSDRAQDTSYDAGLSILEFSADMDRTSQKVRGEHPLPGAPKVLLVEDDTEISRMVVEALRENGFVTLAAATGAEMDALLSQQDVDLIILDVMLPGESGLDICRRQRARSNMPIIFLTALGAEIDRIVGLEIGADDYVTKPFSSRELIARVRALLRRAQIDPAAPTPRGAGVKAYRFSGWRLEPSSRQLLDPASVRVSLTSAEFDLLLAFCQNPGRVLSRDQLLNLTHSGSAGPMGRSIDVHVSRVRQKLEGNASSDEIIKTVRLGGYIFTPAVKIVT